MTGFEDLCDDCLEREQEREIVYNGMHLCLCKACYKIRKEQLETSPKR